MIPNRWYPILECSKLKRRPVGIQRLGRKLVLWRAADGRAVVAPAHCPHRGASLAAGRVVNGELACPWHGFRFDRSGSCTLMPCEGPQARLPQGMALETGVVQESRGLIWLWHGAKRAEYPPLQIFEELCEDTSCASEASYVLPYHYSRMVETNLDLHHTPFVHKPYVPNTPRVELEASVERDHIRSWGVMRSERPGKREYPFRAEAMLPGLGMIELTAKLRILVAATPVDDHHTWLWFRYYQDYSTLPVLRKAIAWIAVQSELRFVQPQDWRLFATLPEGTIDDVPYRFVHADKAIALYRKRRAELLAEPVRAVAS